MIERPYYLDRLKRLRGPSLAKVLTGMRRAGKSGVLRLLKQTLLEEVAEAGQILYVDLELLEMEPLRDARALLDHILEQSDSSKVTYVMVDEAQNAPGIGRVLYELLERGTFDVYLTGSHTRLVERELADVLAGRYVEIPVFPLSFREYLAAHGQEEESAMRSQLFQRYITNGGLPQTLAFEDDEETLREYLDGVYHTVIRRDVSSELGHEDPMVLDAIIRQLMGGIGQATSASSLSKSLSASGRSCSDDTVALYVGALVDAHAFHRAPRFDLKTGMVLKTQEKLYVDDLGLRTLMMGNRQTSLKGMLENLVYLELRRRSFRVYQGKHYTRRIDFVALEPDGRRYYQVEPSVLDEATLRRTLAPLRAERDNYPKTVLTLDEVGMSSHEGIRQQNLIEWLLAG